jgi:hypothetical protein
MYYSKERNSMPDNIVLNRNQCPNCFKELEDSDLIHEDVWDGMTVSHRVALCKLLGLEGIIGSKSYDNLPEGVLPSLMNKHCSGCGTDWELEDWANATSTPLQLEATIKFRG